MKIVVFGSTGMIGSRIATELEQRGHEVIGASRATGTDITDPASVAAAVTGADAVVSAVSARGVDYTLTDVARSGRWSASAGVMRLDRRRRGQPRGRAGLAPSGHPGLSGRAQGRSQPRHRSARVLAEHLGSGLDIWSPAAFIHVGERTGRYRLGGDQLLIDANGNSEISAEDYAIAIADLLEQGAHPRSRVAVAW